jgi:acylphosphatase
VNDDSARLTAWLRGQVQGVGMRWWVRARALELGLVGSATNLRDGRVEVVAQGPRAMLERFEATLRAGESPGSITAVVTRWGAAREDIHGFAER